MWIWIIIIGFMFLMCYSLLTMGSIEEKREEYFDNNEDNNSDKDDDDNEDNDVKEE